MSPPANWKPAEMAWNRRLQRLPTLHVLAKLDLSRTLGVHSTPVAAKPHFFRDWWIRGRGMRAKQSGTAGHPTKCPAIAAYERARRARSSSSKIRGRHVQEAVLRLVFRYGVTDRNAAWMNGHWIDWHATVV